MVTKGLEASGAPGRSVEERVGAFAVFSGMRKWRGESRLWRDIDGCGRPYQKAGRFTAFRRKKDMFKGLILGILLGMLLLAGGVYFYFSSGHAPVATSAAPIPFEKTFARIGLHAYLDKLPHPQPQVPADEANLISGAKVYKEECAVCHGLPSEPKSAVATGMYPAPPQRFQRTGVPAADAWESYWKAENRIRISGLP